MEILFYIIIITIGYLLYIEFTKKQHTIYGKIAWSRKEALLVRKFATAAFDGVRGARDGGCQCTSTCDLLQKHNSHAIGD